MADAPKAGQDKSNTRPFSQTERRDEKASLLIKLIKELGVEYGFERSCKILEKKLLKNRFLLSISKSSIAQNPDEKILNICNQMDMPNSFMGPFQENLADAAHVHFAFEENDAACFCKVYTEFKDDSATITDAVPDRVSYFLVDIGFKWDIFDNTNHALSKYTCYPELPIESIIKRIANIFNASRYAVPFEIVSTIVDSAARKITFRDMLYLEVAEDNKPRRSFDINIYDASLQIKDLYPVLAKMCRHYSIPLEVLNELYDQVSTRTFGHLSGGIDREGRDFFTIYFGAEGHQ